MEKSVFTEEYAIFLQCLKAARNQAGLTQAQVAERLHQSQSFVSKCESGQRRIDVIELRRICEALGLAFLDFIITLTMEIDDSKRSIKP